MLATAWIYLFSPVLNQVSLFNLSALIHLSMLSAAFFQVLSKKAKALV